VDWDTGLGDREYARAALTLGHERVRFVLGLQISVASLRLPAPMRRSGIFLVIFWWSQHPISRADFPKTT
jgi:hypothetical protein